VDVNIDNVGKIGIIQDIPPYELPPEAWSDGKNVLFIDGSVYKRFGQSSVTGNPTTNPYWIMHAPTIDNVDFWVYGGIGTLRANLNQSHATIGSGLGGARDDRWNGVMFGGIALFNNGISDPQMWTPPGLAQPVATLSNWPANTKAKVIRAFDRFLIALNITESSVSKPQMVKWSSSAPIGAVPLTWDETDATKDSREWPLQETSGACIDCKPLGNVNFVYKSDSVHTMKHIGGPFVFKFERKFDFGILAQDCVVEYKRKHFVATHEDVIMHDGLQAQSILDARMRRWYEGFQSSANVGRSYMAIAGKQILVCFADVGANEPNVALVIDAETGTLSIRDLLGVSFITSAPFAALGSTVYDVMNIKFDQMVGKFGQTSFGKNRDRFIGTMPEVSRIVMLEQGLSDLTQPYTAYVERTGLAIVGKDRLGNPKVDQTAIKFVHSVWPKIRLQNGTTIRVYVGSQEKPEGPITWSPPQNFNPDFCPYVDGFDVVGPYIAVRFESTDNTLWKLDGYKLDMEIIGRTAA